MMNFRRLFALLLLVGACFRLTSAQAQLKELGDGGPGPVKALHLTTELVSLAPGIAPGGTQQIGLVITLEEHWHVYWINAGDAGEPPSIKWTLPAGITAGPMQFAVPSRLPNGPLMDYGYEDTAAFPVTVTASRKVKPGPAHLDAHVAWLVCREVCIPGKAHLGIDLTVAAGAAPGPLVGALGQAIRDIPKPLPANMQYSVVGDQTAFAATLITGDPEEDAEFYPLDPDQIENAADQDIEHLPNGIRIILKRAPDAGTLPTTLRGVIKISDTQSYEVSAPVTAGQVSEPAAPSAAVPPRTRVIPGRPDKLTTVSAIGLAFLGGVILNLMPCVFPVLFLKGLALVQSAGEERRHARTHGLVYTLGILVSFWLIVAALLIVRAGGKQAGWGFQLQSPVFLTLLASAIFFFALSLAGMFDIGLSLTSAGGGLAEKQGYTGSFFTGVLATVVATPCTAPLMGVAIGFALAQPAPVTFSIFTSLALGLAAPYLLLSFQPAWTRILPRPGAWMEVFKQLTAVIFFATVIWLAWVYGHLFGADGIDRLAALLGCFLVLAVSAWVLGRWPARRSSTLAAVVLALLALAIPLSQPGQSGGAALPAAGAASSAGGTLVWQPYSRQALEDARKAGHPVFIDFTAAWCLSCQVNERLVLRSAEVQQQLGARKFVLIKADWTQYDPAITAELQSVNRSGVPTYVIYSATGAPTVLPELLTKSIVLDAIRSETK